MALRHGRAGGLDHLREMPPAEGNAEDIGQGIEAQGEEAQLDARPKAQIRPLDRAVAGRFADSGGQ